MLLPPKRGQSYVPERWPNNASLPLGRAIWFNPGRVPLLGILKKWRSPADNPQNYTGLVRNWFSTINLAGDQFSDQPTWFLDIQPSDPIMDSWIEKQRRRTSCCFFGCSWYRPHSQKKNMLGHAEMPMKHNKNDPSPTSTVVFSCVPSSLSDYRSLNRQAQPSSKGKPWLTSIATEWSAQTRQR